MPGLSRLMKTSRIRSFGLLIVGGVLGLGTALSADAAAVTYNGCQNLYTGVIRLLPSSLPAPLNSSCNTTTTDPLLKEVAISWNQVGPVGPQGPQGATGNTGAAGPQGPKGDTGGTGPQGPKGDTGATGPQGLKGDPGQNGTNGINVTSAALPAGDSHCPSGGSSFTAANGTTYACNGVPGRDGTSGTGLASFDALAGLPCNVQGGPNAGTIAISYNPNTHAPVITCVPGNQPLTVGLTSQDANGNAVAPPPAVITSTPAGVTCPSTCSAGFAFNSSVSLSESVPPGWSFQGWGGPCSGQASTCSVPMGGPQSVSAWIMNAAPNLLTLSVVNVTGCTVDPITGNQTCTTSSGSVTVSAGGPSEVPCQAGCQYNLAGTVTLTAFTNVAGAGDLPFAASWSGDCTGFSQTCTLDMSQAHTVTATF